MPESPLHASMKDHAARWARLELGCGIVTQEASIAKRWQFDCRPDVLGVCTDHPESKRLFLSHDIEVEPSLQGIGAEYKKKHRRDPFRSITDYQWLIYPDTIDPDLDSLSIPVWVGLATMTESGVVTVQREAERLKGNQPRAVIGILCGLIKHLERDTGKRADQARPNRSKGLTGDQRKDITALLVVYSATRFPEVPVSLAARTAGMKPIDLRNKLKAGLDGYDYQPHPADTLTLTATAATYGA